MKKLILSIIISLISVPALAINQEDIDSCEIYQQFANDVMIIRQFDTPISEAKQIMQSTYQSSMSQEAKNTLDSIIDASYVVELRDTPEEKKQAVLDFRRTIYRDCMQM